MVPEDVYNTEEGFPVPEQQLPTEEQLLRLKNSDKTVVDELILGLTAYVVNTVKWLVRNDSRMAPYHEDLTSTALLELVEFIPKQFGRDLNLFALLRLLKISVVGACRNYLDDSPAVTLPPATLQRNKTELTQQKLRDYHKVQESNELFGEFELDDFIEVHFDDLQKQIVQRLTRGESRLEISKNLGLDWNTVVLQVKQIRDIIRKEYLCED